jgi:hypothetical protein
MGMFEYLRPIFVANGRKNWTASFVKRHQDQIVSHYLVGFDRTRKKADNYWLVSNYFDLVRNKLDQYTYTPENMYNMDEKGFMIGMLQKWKRIFTKQWQDKGKLQGAFRW